MEGGTDGSPAKERPPPAHQEEVTRQPLTRRRRFGRGAARSENEASRPGRLDAALPARRASATGAPRPRYEPVQASLRSQRILPSSAVATSLGADSLQSS